MVIREHYLKQIRPFYESDLIKIITGNRSAICILCIQMNMNGEVTASSSETVDLGAYASSY